MNLVYVYDGTLEGFLCCVYESFARRELPSDIQTDGGQMCFFEQSRWVETNDVHAAKVFGSLRQKIGLECQDFIRKAFLSCVDRKEILMYRFIMKGYQMGPGVFNHLTDDVVNRLSKAVLGVSRETHNYLGFVRFRIWQNVMISSITPKNWVLPLLSAHFADRYPDESFLIYDKTHSMALIHRPYQGCLLTHLDEDAVPKAEDDRKLYEELWQRFHESISISERKNLRCQMSHLPKRYWADLTENLFAEAFEKLSD